MVMQSEIRVSKSITDLLLLQKLLRMDLHAGCRERERLSLVFCFSGCLKGRAVVHFLDLINCAL